MAGDAPSSELAPKPSPTTSRHWRWLAWLLLTAVACAGFSRYRVENDINAWYPQFAAHDASGTWLLVGFPAQAIDANTFAAALRQESNMQLVIDPAAAELAQLAGSPDLLGLVRSNDGDYEGVLCIARPGVSAEVFVADVRRVIDQSLTPPQREQVALGGPAVFVQAINYESQRWLPMLTMLGFGLATLALRAFIGRWRPALEAALAVAIAQAVTLGTASWLGRPMDMASSMAPALLMAMGMSYAMHRATRTNTTPGLVLAAMTTALGLITFAATDVGPIRQFALIATAGLAVTFFAVISLVTPPQSINEQETPIAPAMGHWRRATIHPAGRVALLGLSVAVSLAGVVALTQINLRSNPIEMFPADHWLRQDLFTIEQHLTGMLPFEIGVIGPASEAQRLIDMVEHTPAVRLIIALPGEGSAPELRRWWGFADQDTLERLPDAFAAWQEEARQMHLQLTIRGPAAQVMRAQQSVEWVARSAFLSMACVAGLVVGMATRSVRWALLSIWVNTLPVLSLAAVLWALDRPIDLPSVMIGSIAVGVAMDDTVHMVLALRRFRSTPRALSEVGPACLASSLVTIASLLPLTMATFKPTAQFAAILSVAILVAAIADLLVLPASQGPQALRRLP